MALVDPDISIAGFFSGADLRGLIEFSAPFDGSMETTCSPAPLGEDRVSCDWEWSTAGTRALGIPTSSGRSFTVTDGIITLIVPPNYTAFEGPLSAFAESDDPAGYAGACSPDGVSPVSSFGYPHNQRCGSFLAGLEAAFVASLGG